MRNFKILKLIRCIFGVRYKVKIRYNLHAPSYFYYDVVDRNPFSHFTRQTHDTLEHATSSANYLNSIIDKTIEPDFDEIIMKTESSTLIALYTHVKKKEFEKASSLIEKFELRMESMDSDVFDLINQYQLKNRA